MKNIIKAVITFATIITFSSANAGVLEVTGTAKATYVVSGGQLNDNGKAVYQGKIFVEKIAQKTDAYQLSKTLILNDSAEFDAKPELEIYADDVKCSHGSTSGNIDSDAVYYLMTRGIPKKEAIKLLINGFLNEVLENVANSKLKIFLEEILKKQINGH